DDGIRDDLVTGVQTCALPISGVGDSRASSTLGTAHAAVRSTSRSRAAMSPGIGAASGPTLRSASGAHSAEGIITPGLRMHPGSYDRFTSRNNAITSGP